jgi:hypothetical protein
MIAGGMEEPGVKTSKSTFVRDNIVLDMGLISLKKAAIVAYDDDFRKNFPEYTVHPLEQGNPSCVDKGLILPHPSALAAR